MGRAMLIIVTGVLVSIGITQVALFGNLSQMDRHSVSYAESVQASNTAHAATQLAVDRLRDDPDWRTGGTPWQVDVDGAVAQVEVETVSPEILSVSATAIVNNRTRTVRTIYQEESLHFVPQFKAALSIMTDLFDFHINGAASEITGNNSEDNCPAVPGVTIPSDPSKDKVDPYSSMIHGDPAIAVDPDSDFDEVSKLISVLEHQPGTKYLPSGNYKGDLGSAEAPGVFFVTGHTKIRGNTEGYGIMVVRKNAVIDVDDVVTTDDGSLDLAGTFDFHGLVIFENAWSLKASGTPAIHGSIMVGTTDDWEDSIGIELNGTPNFNYSCLGQTYAEMASASVNSAGKRFTALSIRE
ncbi:MAG: hypothetical protein ACFCU6_11030 [Balneolaceae bacterium]